MKKLKDEPKLTDIQEKAKAAGAVHCINVEDGDKTYSLYLKKPHRNILGQYFAQKERNPIAAAEMLLKASRIDAFTDNKIFEDDDLFLSAYMEVENYLDVVKLKKSLSVSL